MPFTRRLLTLPSHACTALLFYTLTFATFLSDDGGVSSRPLPIPPSATPALLASVGMEMDSCLTDMVCLLAYAYSESGW